MKLVLYDENKQIKKVIEKVENPVEIEGGITWDTGALTGIKLQYVLLDDAIEVGDILTDTLLSKKIIFEKSEEEKLKDRIQSAEDALLQVMLML